MKKKKQPNPNPTLAELRSKARKVVEIFPQQKKPHPELAQAVTDLQEILDRPTGRPSTDRSEILESHRGKSIAEIHRLTGISRATISRYFRESGQK